MSANIENAILSSFFFEQYYNKDHKRELILDLNIFTSELRKRVSHKLNESEPYEYSFVSYEMQEKIKGTKFEQEFLNILGAEVMSINTARLYHDKLVQDRKIEAIL